MLNVIIELNKENKTFDVKWVMEKEGILEVGKNYCPCCYYRLNSNKNKVIELMDALFKEEATTIPKSEKVIKKMLEEYYASLQEGVLDFNIVISKEIIDDRIPLKGIILKEKHVIVEEVSDKNLGEKDKKILDEIRDGFSGKSNKKFLDDASKIMGMLDNGAKITREDLWNEDGSPKTVEEVYEIVQFKKDIENKTKEFVKDNKIDVEKLLKEMFGQSLSEKSRRGNYSRGVEIEKGGLVNYMPWKTVFKSEPTDINMDIDKFINSDLSIIDYLNKIVGIDSDKDSVKEDVKSNVKTVDDELDKLIKFIKTPNSAL